MTVPNPFRNAAQGWAKCAQRCTHWWQDHRQIMLFLLWIAVAAGGYYGFWLQARDVPNGRVPSNLLYLTFQLFTMNSGAVQGQPNVVLDLCRFLAPMVAAVTAVEAAAQIWREQFDRLRLRRVRQHVVICGLGDKGLCLASAFRACGYPVVVIDPDPKPGHVRQCREQKTIFLAGDATEAVVLERARIGEAQYLISVCADDSINALIAVTATQRMEKGSRQKPRILAHLSDPGLCGVLQDRRGTAPREPALDFFNVYDAGAYAVIARLRLDKLTHGYEVAVPLAVAGTGLLAERVILQLLEQWHMRRRDPGAALPLLILGEGAASFSESLRKRFSQLAGCGEFIPREIGALSGVSLAQAISRETHAPPAGLYVCFERDAQTLGAALELRSVSAVNTLPMVICARRRAGLGDLLHPPETMSVVGLLDITCQPALLFPTTLDDLARAFHVDYLARHAGDSSRANEPGMVSWERLPPELKESNRNQAEHIPEKLQAIGCGLAPIHRQSQTLHAFNRAETELLARMEHSRWLAERERDGWTFGPQRDDDAKKNPLLVPWDRLDLKSQEYNREIVKRLPQFLDQHGFQIYRLEGYRERKHEDSRQLSRE